MILDRVAIAFIAFSYINAFNASGFKMFRSYSLAILCKRFILVDILGRILDEYGMTPIFECIPFHPAVFLHLSIVCYDCMKFRLFFIRWEYCQQVLSVIDFENSHTIGLFLGVGNIDFF